MGGVRQQFSTAAEVELARESIEFFEELGEPYFHQVGYLFLATTEDGLAAARGRGSSCRSGSACAVEWVDPAFVVAGSSSDDVLGAAFGPRDGVADPPAVTRELVRRAAELGVDVRARTGAAELRRAPMRS